MKEQTVIRIDKDEALGIAASLRRYERMKNATGLGDACTHFLSRLERLIEARGWRKEGRG